jgi:acyl-homoserine lactone acylase PvdQ
VERVHPSLLSLSSFTLVALAGFGFIVAGRAPARADDSTAAGAMAAASALAKTVTIQRDTFGVPHIYGPTDASFVFGFIYAQAEDYFWQIEDSYLRSLGRAAEVYGDKSLPDDLVNRALEITRTGQSSSGSRRCLSLTVGRVVFAPANLAAPVCSGQLAGSRQCFRFAVFAWR